MSSPPSAYTVPSKYSKPNKRNNAVINPTFSTTAPGPKLQQPEAFIESTKEKQFQTELAVSRTISRSKIEKATIIYLFIVIIIGCIPLFLYVIHPQAGKDLDAGSNSSAEWSDSSGDSAKNCKS